LRGRFAQGQAEELDKEHEGGRTSLQDQHGGTGAPSGSSNPSPRTAKTTEGEEVTGARLAGSDNKKLEIKKEDGILRGP